jgi:peroxiredoxin (alkyl hydroperoxide reductase subunit C)
MKGFYHLRKELISMLVTKQAPNFSGMAFHEGKMKKVSLEDYRGKWVVVCFYPGDFTFV